MCKDCKDKSVIGLTILAASVFASACGDSGKLSAPLAPTAAPSAVAPAPVPPVPGITGSATIHGVVASRNASVMRVTAASTGLTVTVTGSSAMATVGSDGSFVLAGVPSGTVELRFSDIGTDARGTIDGVAEQEEISVTVNINGSTAKVDVSQRTKPANPENKIELEGPIASINPAARSFRVRDANVVVASAAVIRHGDKRLTFSDLHVGDQVHVRGTRTGSDVVASEVLLQNDQQPVQEVEVHGLVAGLLPGACPVRTFAINGVKVSTDATTKFSDGTCAQLANGSKVDVNGTRQTDGSVKAAEVAFEKAVQQEAEVEGKISGLTGTGACPILAFSVNSTKVSTDGTTKFLGGTCKQLANDMKVEVNGTRQTDGSVKAAEVTLDDNGKK